MLEYLYELKDNIDRHGIRWGLAITLYGLFRKEKRNFRLDVRDEAIFHNLRAIMEQLGVSDQWHGPPKTLSSDLTNFSKWYRSSYKGTRWVSQSRRINMQQTNWITLLPSLLGAIKLILQPFGIVIPDQEANEIINGIAAAVTIYGIIKSHTKGGSSNAQRYGDHGPAI